jgi:DNA-binding MarR family transcriptional regulator
MNEPAPHFSDRPDLQAPGAEDSSAGLKGLSHPTSGALDDGSQLHPKTLTRAHSNSGVKAKSTALRSPLKPNSSAPKLSPRDAKASALNSSADRTMRAQILEEESPHQQTCLEMKALKSLLGFQLRQASFWVSHLYAEHLHTLGLSPLEFSVLEVVNMNAGVTAQQICNELNLRAPNAVKLIQTLCEQDLIERQPHPHDRRAFGIVLTAKGKTLTSQAHEHLSQLEKIGLKGLSERQKNALLKQLELINSSSKKSIPKSKSSQLNG